MAQNLILKPSSFATLNQNVMPVSPRVFYDSKHLITVLVTSNTYLDLIKYFFYGQVSGLVGGLFINAPFGRFTPKRKFLTFDGTFSSSIGIPLTCFLGIKSWMIMEIVAPITFVTTLRKAPLQKWSGPASHAPKISPTASFLAFLFLAHYTNRAILSPLRSPSRSRAHIIVTLCGITFNLINGYLLGAYLSSPEAKNVLWFRLGDVKFLLGAFCWSFGFVGNVVHDELLLKIRRNQKRKAKQREDQGKDAGEHYAIPFGLFFKYVSFPNYLCEWVEWVGFALMASPDDYFTPPWVFFYGEILTMLPRAWRGHQWYHQKFPDYPKGRKAVIPFIL